MIRNAVTLLKTGQFREFRGRLNQTVADQIMRKWPSTHSLEQLQAMWTPITGTLKWMRRISRGLPQRPEIDLAVVCESTETNPSLVLRTLRSVRSQAYPYWNINIFAEREVPEKAESEWEQLLSPHKISIRNASELRGSVSWLGGDFVAFLKAGDEVQSHALFEMIKKHNLGAPADLIYSDDYCEQNKGSEFFQFKPDWSPDLLLATNYIGSFFLLETAIFKVVGGLRFGPFESAMYDLLLRATEIARNIVHVSLPLFVKAEAPSLEDANTVKQILEEALARRNERGAVVPVGKKGLYRVKRELKEHPRVSIIIPTAYTNADANMNVCLRSIVERTSYDNYEIIVIDNSFGKLSSDTIKAVAPRAVRLRIETYGEPFNYAAINNFAMSKASGDYIVFLNDDCEVITEDWLQAMLEHAQQPGVAAVGAKLLFADGTVQHAGGFLIDHHGGGLHAFRHTSDHMTHYERPLALVRNCSFVTFACVMIPKQCYEDLGGLDEGFHIENNDSDFCLRAIQAGFHIVWTPFATLYHKEAQSRHTNIYENQSFFWKRWRSVLHRGDPYYNPNLTLDEPDFSLSARPVFVEHDEPELVPVQHFQYIRLEAIEPESVRKILAVKLDHIGDFILALPAIKMLKWKFPRARIVTLVGPWAKDIAERVPEIDTVVPFEFYSYQSERYQTGLRGKALADLERSLEAMAIDLAIDLRRSPENRKILGFAHARHTVAFSSGPRFLSASITVKIPPEFSDVPLQSVKPHMSAQLCGLVQAIPTTQPASEAITEVPLPELILDPSSTSFLHDSGLSDGRPLIGIHPGTGSRLRQWPLEHFAELADLLVERNDARIILFGAEFERETAQAIQSRMKSGDKLISCVGRMSLMELSAVLARLDLFVGNNSGPCHLAGILGTPTLTVWSGQVLPHEWHPLGKKTMCVRLAVPCSPCYHHLPEHCPWDLMCLRLLWPEKVYEAAQQVLSLGRWLKTTDKPKL